MYGFNASNATRDFERDVRWLLVTCLQFYFIREIEFVHERTCQNVEKQIDIQQFGNTKKWKRLTF